MPNRTCLPRPLPEAPSGPAPAAAAPVFPKPDPNNFTATTPDKDTVNAFLHVSWAKRMDRLRTDQVIQNSEQHVQTDAGNQVGPDVSHGMHQGIAGKLLFLKVIGEHKAQPVESELWLRRL